MLPRSSPNLLHLMLASLARPSCMTRSTFFSRFCLGKARTALISLPFSRYISAMCHVTIDVAIAYSSSITHYTLQYPFGHMTSGGLGRTLTTQRQNGQMMAPIWRACNSPGRGIASRAHGLKEEIRAYLDQMLEVLNWSRLSEGAAGPTASLNLKVETVYPIMKSVFSVFNILLSTHEHIGAIP